jgi:hypothetical protein
VTKALFDKAFDTDFETLDQVIHQPDLGKIEYLELRWKDEMLKQNIISLPYHRYWELWNRLWFVSGTREHVRPYALRVGAGNTLNGKQSPEYL